jgi:hypothetical protein
MLTRGKTGLRRACAFIPAELPALTPKESKGGLFDDERRTEREAPIMPASDMLCARAKRKSRLQKHDTF